MPDGRFLSRTIAVCSQLKQVSWHADFLFGRIIPHLDRDGRIGGEPEIVKAIAVPLRAEITVEIVEQSLFELAAAHLLVWYIVDGAKICEFPGFARHQKGMKYDREAPSRFPAAGLGPDLVRSRSSDMEDLVLPSKEKLSVVKGSEVFPDSQNRSPEIHTAPGEKKKAKREYSNVFEELWTIYPHPPGDSKQDAARCFETRLKEGHTHETMRTGILAYRAYCEAQDWIKTKFCKQGATFFGPGLHFLSDWGYRDIVPKNAPRLSPADQTRANLAAMFGETAA